jgi:hypothetical protein
MRKLFIESSSFAEEVDRILDEYAYYALQNQLMENPDRGKVIPGTGGLRKLRSPIHDDESEKGAASGSSTFIFQPSTGSIFSTFTKKVKSRISRQPRKRRWEDWLPL